MDSQSKVRSLLLEQLEGQNAHINFERAVEGVPFEDLGKQPAGLPHSIWELAEHIRIAQADIVEFSQNPDYTAPNWPEDYWPKQCSPENDEAWQELLRQVHKDHYTMVQLVKDPSNDLFKPFEHGDGQTLFREAMLIVDHNAYHVGQIVQLRRLLGNWERK